MKSLHTALRGAIYATSAILVVTASQATPAFAQDDYVVPHAAFCGAMQDGVWVPNGNCVDDTSYTPPVYTDGRVRGRVTGTITSVTGHLVTVQQSSQSLVINDQPALNDKQTGRIAVGRQIIAHGFWRDGTFYATSVE
jgi:hypothetical protein